MSSPNNVKLIRQFFEDVTLQEIKELSKDERNELGKLIAEELGVEHIPT